MMIDDEKNNEIYGYQTLYREVGYYITRKEQFERALKYFDSAVEKTPNDKRALMGRSWARAKACQYQGALDDVDKALKLDRNDLVLLAQKALNTYLSCEFEKALIQNTHYLPIRKKPDNFAMGVLHCSEAIENCLGGRAGRPMRDHFKIIRKLAWKKCFEEQKPYEPKSKYKKKKKKKKKAATEGQKPKKTVREPVAPLKEKKKKKMRSISESVATLQTGSEATMNGSNVQDLSTYSEFGELEIRDSLYTHASEEDIIPPYAHRFPYRPLQRYTTNIENYMAEKYLDSMYRDKIFLKNLRFEPGIKCPNKAGSKKMIQLSKQGYKNLCYNQELLRTRRPFYFLKFQEGESTGALRERQLAELKKLQVTAQQDADALIEMIEEFIENKQTKLALEYAEKLKIYCDSKPKKILPHREDYLVKMYKLICKAHFIMKRLNKEQFNWDQEKRIFNALGIPQSREPSTDSVIEQTKAAFVDWGKQISIYEERLRKATKAEEMAWLYHELARFHAEQKQCELARVYARKCMREGRRCGNLEWVINAYMLVVKTDVLQRNRNDAKSEILETIEVARSMNNPDLVEYLQKCLSVIERAELDESEATKVLEKREKKILEMMSGTPMKDEAAYLFRKMSVMPANRRMSVMPGVRLDDEKDAKAASNRKMSIMPHPTDDDMPKVPRTPSKKLASSKKADEASKGVGFMDFVQYHLD